MAAMLEVQPTTPSDSADAVLRSSRPERARGLGVASVAFLAFAAFAVFVLALGAVAARAGTDAALHDWLHELALSNDLGGRLANRMSDTAHRDTSGWQLALDYGFSIANLALAGFLFWLRPKDRTAPLLAFGLVGTAAVFNLQAHAVYEAIAPNTFEAVTHVGFQVVAAVSYLLALLLFPDGRLVPRWRPAALTAFYATTAVVVVGLAAWSYPSGSRTLALVIVFGLLTPAAGVLAQAYRYRRSSNQLLRQQSRLLFWALSPALVVSLFALTTAAQETGASELEGRAIVVLPVALFRLFQPVFLLIPVALLAGIFRFRLWDVDKLISRTLVYGVLAGFVSAVYVAVVVGVGSFVGRPQDQDLALPIVATFIVAAAFQPLKERVQRLANRLVYGKRATPYEALSEFAERVNEIVGADELLARMARILAEGTGATRADVWLKVGDELRPQASWSGRALAEAQPIPVGDEGLPPIPQASQAIPVLHHGELFGALSIVKPLNEELTPIEAKLLADFGRQAGLVFRNLQLTAELRLRLQELQASRQRLVSAQDEGRRRTERNLHDGAQQQLVALKVHLALAEGMAQELGDEAQPLIELIGEIKVQAGDALEELRDLARGIYPPLLAADGLPAALASQAAKAPLPVELDATVVGRYSQEVEAAVYFCCLEAIQNVCKYARASRVGVRLAQVDGALEFTVDDDGCGFDSASTRLGAGLQNMSDRLGALGGTVEITSAPDCGTTVVGRIPANPVDGSEEPARPAAPMPISTEEDQRVGAI
jgi:signal transduction histidine kinase